MPKLPATFMWTQFIAWMLIGILSFLIILSIYEEIDAKGYYQILAAVSVLVVFITLLVPIFSRLEGAAEREPLANRPATSARGISAA